MEITAYAALDLARMIKIGELGVEETLLAFLRRTESVDREINAFVRLRSEADLRREAAAVQRAIDEGSLTSPLAGIPFAVKDNICTKGIETTCGSPILCGYLPSYDATAVARLQAAGCLLLGKTNLDEFAMGSTTETSLFGPVCNPYDRERTAGGSGGGSAAAVAAGMVPLTLGSDTGGSIRQPTSHCNLVGLKPTYGAVSRYGLIAYGSSLEQIGLCAARVDDVAAAFALIRGADGRDSRAVEHEYADATADGLEGLRIGVLRFSADAAADDVKQAICVAASVFGRSGATVSVCDLQMDESLVNTYYMLVMAEAYSNLARYDGMHSGVKGDGNELRLRLLGAEVKRRINMGAYILSEGHRDDYYRRADAARAVLRARYAEALRSFDILLSPVTADTAPLLGSSLSDPAAMYETDAYTVAANLTGLPALSVPCGFDRQGMPIGMQLLAAPFAEPLLLRAGRHFERLSKLYERLPNGGGQDAL